MSGTIFAQASATGRAGVAVFRISGPEAFTAVRLLAGPLPDPRVASLRWLKDPNTGMKFDQALVLCFPGPSSFTGEDVAELHLHGGVAVRRALEAALFGIAGLRAAEAGEFTRRALMNGRMDLSQVEGLGDLLAAETSAQLRQARNLMRGDLSDKAARWREDLVGALAYIEATIDFADEDLPDDVLARIIPALDQTARSLRDELRQGRAAERLREGFEVALVGVPNAGKSTLLNAIARREAAITSEIAGTTRDVIECRMDLEGLPVTLLDMAGLREAEDKVERLGIARARDRAETADLRIFLITGPEDLAALGVAPRPGDPVVLAKADLGKGDAADAVSGLTGSGVDALLSRIAAELSERTRDIGTASHERQIAAIARAADAVDQARARLSESAPGAELVAEDIHIALQALDFLIGRIDVEAVLDVIFQSFCIGK